MDKETLSNYGWIVICVMVLAVMIALSGPFGNFVANAVKSTTQGLFDVNQNALDAAGIEMKEQEFENMLSGTHQNGCPIKYGRYYLISEGPITMSYIFYQDGSLKMEYSENGQILMSETAPAGTVGYDGLNLTAIDEETGKSIVVATITVDGKQIDMGEGMILTLDDCEHKNLITDNVQSESCNTAGYTGDEICSDCGRVFSAGEYIAPHPDKNKDGYCDDCAVSMTIGLFDANDKLLANWDTLKNTYGLNLSANYSESSTTTLYHILNSNSELSRGAKLVLGDDAINIGEYAFKNCYNIKTIILPNTIEHIGRMAFADSSIATMNVPESVKSLDGYAFAYAYGLKTITLSPNITSIGYGAFSGCSNLTSIHIPNNVNNIGESIFQGCTNLSTITVDLNNPTYHSKNNCIIKTDSKTLIAGCKNSVIPSDGSVTVLGISAFIECRALRTVGLVGSGSDIEIPNNITVLESAFGACNNITSVILPNSITTIGNSAFWACSSLESITIPQSVKNIGYSVFQNCDSLTTINYTGTMEQWNNIEKNANWKSHSVLTSVICSDGTISLS